MNFPQTARFPTVHAFLETINVVVTGKLLCGDGVLGGSAALFLVATSCITTPSTPTSLRYGFGKIFVLSPSKTFKHLIFFQVVVCKIITIFQSLIQRFRLKVLQVRCSGAGKRTKKTPVSSAVKISRPADLSGEERLKHTGANSKCTLALRI